MDHVVYAAHAQEVVCQNSPNSHQYQDSSHFSYLWLVAEQTHRLDPILSQWARVSGYIFDS
jgi:hypothetical protein